MAIYGISLYGRDKYGHTNLSTQPKPPGKDNQDPEPSDPGLPPDAGGGPAFEATQRTIIDYDVQPFTAEALDFERIRVGWNSPEGDWSEFRVVKNWTGFPVTYNDGVTIFSSKGAATQVIDRDVKPGFWHYYAIWVKAKKDGVWQRSGTAVVLMLESHETADWLFNNLPLHHALLQGNGDDLKVIENSTLRKFLKVLALGLEYCRTQLDSMQFLHDPMNNNNQQLLLLAEQLGVDYSPTTPAIQYRKRVRDAASLAREKGTFEQIRTMCSMLTGWDVDLWVGNNLMLNEDQASFVHPTFPLWDSAINYPKGFRVSYNGYLYEAKVGVYGGGPSGTPTDTVSWKYISNLVDTTLLGPDKSYAGWVPAAFGGGTPPTNAVAVGVGIQSPLDPTVSWANALIVQNTGATAANLGARSAGDPSKPDNPVLRGVPVPRALTWDSQRHYKIGDVVKRDGNTYVAAKETVGVVPGTDNTVWEKVSPFDARKAITVSVHGKGTTAAAQGRTMYPVIDLFDVHGVHLCSLDTSTVNTTTNVFDSLANGSGSLNGTMTDVGNKTWTVARGDWQERARFGTYASGPGLVTLPGAANGQVAVTLSESITGNTLALVFRGTDASNYLKATAKALYSVSGGVATLIGNYSKPLKDGDRLTAVFNGSSVTILRNGAGVLSVTSSFNTTGTLHGMLVE